MIPPVTPYLDPQTFCGDAKAFFARLVTLGWVMRLRLRANGHPLGEEYAGSLKEARMVVPLLYQLSDRPLLDLVDDYFHGPVLYREASQLMMLSRLRDANETFRLLQFDYGPEMAADFQTVTEWLEDRSVLFEGVGRSLQSGFLQTEEWSFRTGWRHCCLELRSMQASVEGITRVSSNQLAGNWSPLGYVRRTAADPIPDEAARVLLDRTMLVPGSHRLGKLEREACVCPRAIELHSALMIFKPRNGAADHLSDQQMRQVANLTGLDNHDLYVRFVALLTEFVFWHECGHIHYDDLELELHSSLISESYYSCRYGLDYSELAAECYAIQQCIDSADHVERTMILAFFLRDEAGVDDLSLCELVKIRSLREQTPSAYIEEFLHLSISQMRTASAELERRARQAGVTRQDLCWSAWLDEQMKNADPFVARQTTIERQVRREVAAWLLI